MNFPSQAFPPIFLFISGILLFSSPVIAQQPAAIPVAISNQRSDQLQADIPKLMQQADVPGFAIALIQDGRPLRIYNFGFKNAETKQPVTDDTIFEAASLSKPVFAYAVLKLVDQGKLGLDVPLTTYLPKPYIEGDPRLEKITARIVLSHRTGFRNWRGDGNPLAVIDSEMPETLRRLGLWKEGDALPVPPRMPQRCTLLVMRKGVEWCEP